MLGRLSLVVRLGAGGGCGSPLGACRLRSTVPRQGGLLWRWAGLCQSCIFGLLCVFVRVLVPVTARSDHRCGVPG